MFKPTKMLMSNGITGDNRGHIGVGHHPPPNVWIFECVEFCSFIFVINFYSMLKMALIDLLHRHVRLRWGQEKMLVLHIIHKLLVSTGKGCSSELFSGLTLFPVLDN